MEMGSEVEKAAEIVDPARGTKCAQDAVTCLKAELSSTHTGSGPNDLI